ncbi:non-ribosomal peptide synthetase [Xenorhabdus griffiniae]|uniref:Non-ribosomal peptide synthetase n=1 Tax=Xenorhabdus griffiniae TaxID=351672 RepID=A0ABY9XML2_9GAMM|nr:non-ribosomal peptide synthetase [Xenorhabdus griffiniae]MBD1227087.1 amino acid adenylation domain-containing protein [Xenorhabdus griffiniae]MBE8586738.1 amino acid adenylation domain-containing protein [Xenorhabdus griffiniae]WMV74115.1 non-ribosomal peptide synthetase [Xenorhabdus griffiniae]WNH03795.1 non-ribosomal peptide synthetase [Xenorhabdus griffiniae]
MGGKCNVSDLNEFIEILMVEHSVDFSHDLFDQGMTSKSIMQVLIRIRERFDVDLNLDEFLRTPTMARLRHLISRQIENKQQDIGEPVRAGGTLQRLEQLMKGKAFKPNQDLFEHGFNSLNVMELVLAVKKQFDVDIELETLLSKPTLETLAVLIDQQCDQQPVLPVAAEEKELSVLSSLSEKQAFKEKQFNIRHLDSNFDTVRAKTLSPEQFQQHYNARRTFRVFDDAPMPKDSVLGWLSALNAMLIDGRDRYLYPSAGGTYSVQIYVEIKPGRVGGFSTGFYYYNPVEHKLDKISSDELPHNSHFYYNRPYYDNAHCCLYFVVEYDGIRPLYKEKSDFFAAIEIGAIIQLLAQKQAYYPIGSCPLSGVDETALAGVLKLKASQRTLLGMAFGLVEKTQFQEPEINSSEAQGQDIAIIGVQGKYPDAPDIETFWQNLNDQKNCFSRVPDDRWGTQERFEHWGGFAHSITNFDADFFGISATERERISAQEACFLTSVYELLDSAGYNGENLQHLGPRVGVFTGVMWNEPAGSAEETGILAESVSRSTFSSIVNRVSWFFNWTGPSLAVDTSCSSSLTSIYLACQAIAQGDCDVAVAGGINLFAHATHFTDLKRFNMISERCDAQVFGEDAAGIIPGEGVGVVLLKPLSQAEADNDHIWGVIKGGGIAHSGRVSGYGVPSTKQQSELLKSTLQKTGYDADAVDYIEAAAAGTVFGDASEIRAIQTAFAERHSPLFVGTLKPNIGHLESASGISQVTKVLLQMKHGYLLPVMPYNTLSPLIKLDDSPVSIVAEPRQWQGTRQQPKLAMVNSFGSTGSYANLLLQSYHPSAQCLQKSANISLPELFVLSAKSPDGLQRYAERWVHFFESALKDNREIPLQHLFAVVQSGREHFNQRLAIPASSVSALLTKLKQWLADGAGAGIYQGRVAGSDTAGQESLVFNAEQNHEIAEVWVKGQWQNWQHFHRDEPLPKMPLPVYPLYQSQQDLSPMNTQPRESAISHRLPVDSLSPAQAADERSLSIKELLLSLIARILQQPLEQIDSSMSLFALGMSSSQAVKFVRMVESHTGMNLPIAILLEKNSVIELSDYLTEQYGEKQHAKIKGNDSATSELQKIIQTVQAQAINTFTSAKQARKPETYPLSEGQKGLWVLHKHAPQNSAYNCPVCFRVNGRIDPQLFQQALNLLVKRYPILATTVFEEEGLPYLFNNPQSALRVNVETALSLTEKELEAYLLEKINQPFDFDNDALLRVNLLYLSEKETIILLCAHHIVVDAMSVNPMVSALFSFYHQLSMNQPPVVEAGKDNWYDFVMHEQVLLQSDEGKRRLDYWKKTLAGAPVSTKLLADSSYLNVEKYKGETLTRTLSTHFSTKLKAFADTHSVYLSSVFLSLFQLVIHRFTRQDDIVIGMPTDARTEEHQREKVGYYVYPIPVRSQLSQDIGYLEYLRTLQQTVLDGLAHALPFPVVVRTLNLSQSMDDSPLFQMAFVYQQAMPQKESQALGKLILAEYLTQYSQTGEYEFMLEVVEAAETFTLNIKYNPSLYHQSTALSVIEHLTRLLQEVVEQPERKLIDFPLVDQKESVQILKEWNRTAVNLGEACCVHELFEQQAAKTPEAVAVVFEDLTLTYQALNAKANQLAYCLQKLGVQAGTRVGICLERSVEMIVGLLGILKAGGAYVPLEPSYPAQRLAYILKDSGVPVVLTQKHHQSIFTHFDGKLLFLNAQRTELHSHHVLPNPVGNTPDNLCYVLYTSGSTGTPKGCMLPHSAIVNRLRWMQDKYRLNVTDNVLQKTPYSFDVSVWEFFWPLMAGATLVFAIPEGHKDPDYLIRLIGEQQITTCHFVPSMLNVFINTRGSEKCVSLARIFTSGEALPYSVLERVNQKLQVKLHNLYGPTEAAIDVSYWEAEKREDKKTLIGKPIANTQLYIVDDRMNLLPVGAPGELLIGGAGLAKGYLNLPELTEKCFIPHPFSCDPTEKVYRTGDLARWSVDGNIEFLGRIDTQVKVRGFRIELGEIEECLKSCDGVKACAVLLKEDAYVGNFISAYVVLHQNMTLSIKELNAFLKQRVPDFMVPAQMNILDELPVTSNGKLDRKALSALETTPLSDKAFVEPSSAIEQQLADIWKEVLNRKQIGINDNFFEIGGHSLTAITLLSRIQDLFPENKLSLIPFYQAPTITGMIPYLSGTGSAEAENAEKGFLSLLHRSQEENQITLVCVPYAGAAATVYQPLAQALAKKNAGYSVYGVTVPGNAFGSRYEETGMDYNMLAELCAREIVEHVPGKVAIYGHCVGSYLALEITRRLELKGKPAEFLVTAAAFPLPRIVRYLPFNDRWKHKSDGSLLQLLKKWGIPADGKLEDSVARFLVFRFRKDAKLAYQYEKQRGNWRITTPLVNLVSKQDPLTKKYASQYLKWKQCAHDVSLITLDEGHHYFITTYPERVADVIEQLTLNANVL